MKHKQAKVEDVIRKLNPIIRGWENHYHYRNAKDTYSYIDHRIWMMLWRWKIRRHRNKGKHWVKARYFRSVKGRTCVFSSKTDGNTLIFMESIRIRRYVKIKGYYSSYDPELGEY